MEEIPRSLPPLMERLLPLMLTQLGDVGLIFLDSDGRVVGWSSGAEHIFGHSAEEMLGRTIHSLFTQDDQRRGIPELELRIAASSGRAEDDRWQMRKDGTRIWVSGSASSLRDERGELLGFVKETRDRTDVKGQLDDLEHRVEKLREADRRKDVFLGTLAHELRNPLSPLMGAARLIRMTAGEIPGVEEPLRIVERQVDFMRRLVDDLSDVTRISAGKIRLDVEELSVADLVARAIETCQPLIGERGHALDVLLPSKPILVSGDPDRLHQILVNLINNSAKYTPPGGRIWVKATVEGNEAVIRVQDNGEGISPELLPSIFDLFTQAHESSKQSAGGLGIGLALVKNLVSLHGGSIQVRSGGHGKGSEFTVRLPLVGAPSRSGA